MNSAHTDVSRTSRPRLTSFASRAANGGYWVLAIALLGVYCGLHGYGERERRAAITLFLQPHPVAVEVVTAVEPLDRPREALARP